MSRSLKKGVYVYPKLLKKIERAKNGDTTPIKTWKRASTITPEMVGLTIGVHDGRKHVDVYIEEAMIGHKLGEFAHTRTFKGHGGKLAKDTAR